MTTVHPGTSISVLTGGATVPVFDQYSLAERDRRWDALRRQGAEAGLDCVFVPLGDGPDGRYLTQLRVAAVVLPTDGRPPVVITDRNARSAWVPEPWHTSRLWARLMADALLEMGMERGRIGVVGLQGGRFTHLSSPDGVAVHAPFAAVLEHLPDARFEDATDVLGAVRAVKGDEEIACLRRGAEMAEAAIQDLIGATGEGRDAAVVYGRTASRLLQQASAYVPQGLGVRRAGTTETRWYDSPPLGVRLAAGDLLESQVRAQWGELIAEEQQPVLIGPVPDAWRPAIEAQRAAYEQGLRWLAPGTPASRLVEETRRLLAEQGLQGGARLYASGLGDDGPRIDEHTDLADCGWTVQARTTWTWAPVVRAPDGFSFAWGGSVVVTDSGAEGLSRRPHGLATA